MTLAALAGALVVMASACGVAQQTAPQPIQPPAGAALRTQTPQPDATASGRAVEYLYFVQANTVVRVTRHATTQPSTTTIVKDLLTGPNDTESAAGYTSALLGPSVVDAVQITAGQAVVALATPVADTARNDEVLAYAQLVCTLTALAQISGVTFTSGGHPIAVPRGDGSLAQVIDGRPRPLTASDYTELIAR